MSRLRVLIVTSSDILRDILSRGLSREGRLEVDCIKTRDLRGGNATVAVTHEADAILLAPLPGEQSLDPLEVLYQNPSAIVITLENDGRSAAVRQLKPEISFHSNVSVEELAASILSACDDFRDSLPGSIRLHAPRL